MDRNHHDHAADRCSHHSRDGLGVAGGQRNGSLLEARIDLVRHLVRRRVANLLLTPPVGFALFYIKGVCPPEIKLKTPLSRSGALYRDTADSSGPRSRISKTSHLAARR